MADDDTDERESGKKGSQISLMVVGYFSVLEQLADTTLCDVGNSIYV